MLRHEFCRPRVRELASGVDALYLSGRCELSAELVARFDAARLEAVNTGSAVVFEFGGYEWELQPHGLGRYRFRLDHELAVVGVTTKDRLPTFRVQARAEALHCGLGPDGLVAWISSAVGNEGLSVSWTVSRIDLHADVQGWQLDGNDRHRFGCRARALATYEDDGELSGFTFGTRSSKSVNGRIYDKTREIAGNGNDWWLQVWGARRDPELPVLRVEFELHRAALKEMGIDGPASALSNVGRLWAYSTNDWLTYRRRSAHERSARWPIAAEWEKVQRCSLATGALPMDRIRAGRAAGKLRRLLPGLNGYVASFASWTGHDTIDEACAALPEYLRAYEQQSRRGFGGRVAEKKRRAHRE